MNRRIRQIAKIYKQTTDEKLRCRAFCAVVNRSRGRYKVSMELGKMKIRSDRNDRSGSD